MPLLASCASTAAVPAPRGCRRPVRKFVRQSGCGARPWLPRATEESPPSSLNGSEAESEVDAIARAMSAARRCEASGLSPGAGLEDPEAQAAAAFADMINTTVDVTGEALSGEDLEGLARGGTMDAKSKEKKSGGLLDDVRDLFGALSKGAHIVRQKNGRV